MQLGATYRWSDPETFTDGHIIQLDYEADSQWRVSLGYVSGQTFTSSHGSTWGIGGYLYGTGQYVVTFRPNHTIRPFVGLGVSIHPSRIPLLGGWGSFATSMGVNFGDSLFLEIRHNSTAGLTSANWGQDMVQIGYRF